GGRRSGRWLSPPEGVGRLRYRRVLARPPILLGVLLALVAPALSPAQATGASAGWHQFRGTPDHTGFNPAETAISVADAHSLVERWTGDVTGYLESSPAIGHGVLYIG